ncbi:MAG TPA: hypothetical protein VG796_15625 [Verrucomicrobiales bacterium]|nr:hypothetical protein [Verrucomicrobiales bacterium]
MKVFALTMAAGLLTGWWIHTRLQRNPAELPSDRAQTASSPGQRTDLLSYDDPAPIPESEVPALAEAAVKKCTARDAEWATRLMPLWIRWAEFAPKAALDHLDSAGPSIPMLASGHTAWIKDILLAVWASHDPIGAAAWIREQKIPKVGGFDGITGDSIEEEADFPALMDTLTLRDFQTAFSLIPFFFNSRSKTEKGSDFTKQWMPVFYGAAITDANLPWFLQATRSISREDIRGQLCADLMSQLREFGTPNSAEIIARLPIPDRWPDGMMNPWAALAWDDVHKSPEPEKTADAYMAKLKAGDPGKSLMLEWIMNSWTERDPQSAGQWLRKWDGDPAARAARAAFVRKAANKDAVATFELAREFSEPRVVAETAQTAYIQWHERNPVEADQWLKEQDLPPALVSLLLGAGKAQ